MNKSSSMAMVAVLVMWGVLAPFTAAQVSDQQTFTVTVPSVLVVTAPANATITHDQDDVNQAFNAQQWVVQANAILGANISFATNQAFTHTGGNFKRDAKLDLAIDSSDALALWNVSTASAQTDHDGGQGVATVVAESSLPGNATFNLTVTFVETGFSTLAAGNYSTTVTATLTAN